MISVGSHLDNSIDVEALEEQARRELEAGRKIAAIVATIGTTDAFGIDDLAAIRAVRDRLVARYQLDYRPHIHADAVIGWAWSVFNDYDFLANELGFRGRTLRALAAAQHRIRYLKLADTIGIDFHKTGFAPYVSSLILAADREEFQRICPQPRVDALSVPVRRISSRHVHAGNDAQRPGADVGAGQPAAVRQAGPAGPAGACRGDGRSAARAHRMPSGPDGAQRRERRPGDAVPRLSAGRRHVHGQGPRAERRRLSRQLLAHNEYNRRIFQRVHEEALAGQGVAISLTDCYRHTDYGEPIVALKSYVLSPFSDEARMHTIIQRVLAAREAVEASGYAVARHLG